MHKRELELLGRFVSNHGVADLFAYFEVSRDADLATVEAAVRSRRAWAQGQQANPKYRQTAIWLIKNLSLCKRALGRERSAYIAHIDSAAQSGALAVLENVLDGAVYNHELSIEREEAVLDRGIQLGLPDQIVEHFIEDYLDRHDARRATPIDFVDLYEVIGVNPDASGADIDAAVRTALAKAQGKGPTATRMRRTIRRAARLFRSPDLRANYNAQLRQEYAAVPGLAAPNEREQQLLPQHNRSIQLRRTDEEAAQEAAKATRLALANAPPAPPSLGGRSLPIGASGGPVRRPVGGPRFDIEGELQRTVRVGRSPQKIEVVIRTVGSERLHGRIMSDRSWLTVSPDRLDPNLREQTIVVTIDPTGLTRNRAVALCTIIANRGCRKSVTVTAERRVVKPQWVAAGALVLLAGATAVAWPRIAPVLFPPPPPPPPSGSLSIFVDPPAGEIHIDGQLRSAGGKVEDIAGLSVSRPIPVRVLLDGFQVWEQAVQLEDGQTLTLEPTLVLTDPMDYEPDADAIQGVLDTERVSSAIRSRGPAIQSCISAHHPGEPRTERALEIVAMVVADGHIGSLSFNGSELPSAGAGHCIKRQLRSLRLPLFQGNYGVARESFIVHFPSPEPSEP